MIRYDASERCLCLWSFFSFCGGCWSRRKDCQAWYLDEKEGEEAGDESIPRLLSIFAPIAVGFAKMMGYGWSICYKSLNIEERHVRCEVAVCCILDFLYDLAF